MADVIWVGRQKTVAQVVTLTVTASAVSGTITVTVGGVKSITYTCTTTSTTTSATGLYALLAASTEPEFAEITWANPSAGVITGTGPADGRPITVTKADAGSSTSTLSTTTAAMSPNDVNDGKNWSTGSVPANGDNAIFEDSAISALWNLSALNAITCKPIRRASYTGQIGLPAVNDRGYVEYRARYFQYAGTTLTIDTVRTDSPQQFRFQPTAAGASTITIRGDGAGVALGDEPVELTGAASTTVVNVAGSGVRISPLTGQTSVVGTVRAVSSTVYLGGGVTATTLTFDGCNVGLDCNYDTMTINSQSTVTADRAAGGSNTIIDSGTLVWKSTAAIGTPVIGSGGVLDLSQAPAPVSLPDDLTINEGGTFNDPTGRAIAAGAYNIVLNRTEITKVGIDIGTNRTINVAS